MTIQDFITERGITAVVKPAKNNAAMDDGSQWYKEASHYRVTLKRPDKRRITTPFSCGSLAGYPTAEGVLDCLLIDASSADAGSFEDFCSELGYDTDSRKAYRTYQACKSIADRLKAFLGHEYQMAVYEMERL